MGFRGNIVSCITWDTCSEQGMLFGTFLMKNIFIIFPTRILNPVFALFRWNFHAFLKQTWWLCVNTAWYCRQNLWKSLHFWWNQAKTWFKIRVGKLMKIFVIRNVPNNIPWSLKVSPVTWETILTRKTMIFSCVFMFSDYCRDSYSKCMRCVIASQKHPILLRARSQK